MLLRFSNFIGEFVEQVGLLAPCRPRCMTREALAARGFRSPGADVGGVGPVPAQMWYARRARDPLGARVHRLGRSGLQC